MPGLANKIGGRLLGTTTHATRICSGSAEAVAKLAAKTAVAAIHDKKRIPCPPSPRAASCCADLACRTSRLERGGPNRYNQQPERAGRGAHYVGGSITMNLVLYYAPVACSLVPYITLTEAGAQFEVRPVNMGKRQQMSADYLKVNPCLLYTS